MLCSHCGRTGHERRDCWQIIGFPEWWSEHNAQGTSANRGHSRGGRGSGFASGRGRGQVNAAHATSSNSSSFPEFTTYQWKAISQLIQEKTSAGSNSDKLSGKKDLGDVILDTGASHHMTGTLGFLTNIEGIPPCSVGFADGSKTFAVSVGTFALSDKVRLTKVLYVLALNCTLISVSKILKQINCFATFTDTLCVLQDRFSEDSDWNR